MEKYIVIPEKILNNKELCINAKILLAKINLLSYEKGYCYASNKYLGNLIDVSSRTITRLISELKNANLITIKYSDDNERRIYIN
jgi:DNA-binding MarR family transcriptional regulator